MSNPRGKGAVNVTVWMDEEMLEAVEWARKSPRLKEDRSTFIRKAVAGRLDELGAGYQAERSHRRSNGVKTLLPRRTA